MKKISLVLGVLLLLGLSSCSKNKHQQEEAAQRNASEAVDRVDSIYAVIAGAKVRLDSVKHASYATPEEKEAALSEVQETIDGAQSAMENAVQKFEAAKQAYKDLTGSDIISATVQRMAEEAKDSATNQAAQVKQDVKNVKDAATQAAEQTVNNAKEAATQTVENAKTAAKQAAQDKVNATKKTVNDKVNEASKKANDAVNKAQEDANKKVADGLNKVLNK